MMPEEIDVVVSGHLCIDLIPEMLNVSAEAMVAAGRLWEIGPMTMATGGSVSNTGLALHNLGANVRLMANVGDDLMGNAIVGFLKGHDESLGELITVEAGQASSYTVVLAPKSADRTLLHCPGTNVTFGVANINFSLVGQARIFHLGYPQILPRLFENDGEELAEVYRRAKAQGVVTSLDMAMPDPTGESGKVNWQAVLEKSLPYVDIFLPSIEEILMMLRKADFEARQHDRLTRDYLSVLADELLDMGGVITGFKLGSLGMYLKTASKEKLASLPRLPIDAEAWAACEHWSSAFDANVVNTIGAGDSAYAGFLVALLHGLSPQDALQAACAVGGCNVEAPDAVSGVPSWEAMQARIAAGWGANGEKLAGY